MTAQILAAELGTLIQDSKRKNTELRTAAEQSLQDLKSLPNTSESQLSAGELIPYQQSESELTLGKTSHDARTSYHHSLLLAILTMPNSRPPGYLASRG